MEETFTGRPPASGSSRTAGGLTAGIVGGLALAVFMVLVAAAQGESIWPVFKLAGYPFTGSRAFEPGFAAGPIVVGILCHLAVSVVWGLLFSLLFYGFSKGATVGFGLLWGLVAWASMLYIVMPIVGLASVAARIPPGLAVVEHLVFGLFLALGFLPFQRRIQQPDFHRRVSV